MNSKLLETKLTRQQFISYSARIVLGFMGLAVIGGKLPTNKLIKKQLPARSFGAGAYGV